MQGLEQITITHFDVVAGGVFGFITALIGAFVGGLFTLKGVEKEAEITKQKTSKETLELQLSVLKGIKCEITILFSLYNQRMRSALDNLKSDEPFLYIFPVGDDNFTFYENNANEVAKLSDDSRESIISIYIYARSLIETYKANNKFVDEYLTAMIEIKKNDNDRFYVEIFNQKRQLLATYAQSIKKIDAEVTEVIKKGFDAIDNEIKIKTAMLATL
jgi:hypothetical protein